MFTFDPYVAVRMFNWMSRFHAIREETGTDGAFFPTVQHLICLQIPLFSDENLFTPIKESLHEGNEKCKIEIGSRMREE
jgi:hypothetical protein